MFKSDWLKINCIHETSMIGSNIVQIVTATSSTALAGGVLSGSDHNGSNKKPSPPKQINIFSALEDDVVQSKKASPGVAGKKMSTRIEMSCTYQPPKSASKTIFSGVKTSDEITK